MAAIVRPAPLIALVSLLAAVAAYGLRGGVLAALAALLMLFAFVKFVARPTPSDVGLVVGMAAAVALAAGGVFAYVRYQWESAEVAVLTLATKPDPMDVRTWVADDEGTPTVLYDSTPAAAAVLKASTPLTLERNGTSDTRIPRAVPLATAESDVLERTLALFDAKYGHLNGTIDLYYAMLGRARDRETLLIRLEEPR